MGSDQVDLREDLSSEQGGTGSASGSSVSASAYRGMDFYNIVFHSYLQKGYDIKLLCFTRMLIFTFYRCIRLKR